MTAIFNHAFTFAFSLNASDPSGEHVSAGELRAAITNRLSLLTDDELIENCGLPFDTYELEKNRHDCPCGQTNSKPQPRNKE